MDFVLEEFLNGVLYRDVHLVILVIRIQIILKYINILTNSRDVFN